MKISLAVAGVALVAASLSACGGDSAYCSDLEEVQALQDLQEGDFAGLEEGIERIKEVADNAPDEIKDDWEVLTGLLTDLEEGLSDAGLSFEQLGDIQGGQIPEDVDVAKLQELGQTFASLSTAEVTESAQAIEEHAQEECDVDLSPTS